jgi:hypothetical protein
VILDEVIKVVNRRGKIYSTPNMVPMLISHSKCYVSIPNAAYQLSLTNPSEHVIIPRTENTIKCMVSCNCPYQRKLIFAQISTPNWMSWTEKNSSD